MQRSVKNLLSETDYAFTFAGSFVDPEGATHNYTLYNNVTFRQIVQQLFGQRIYNDWDEESNLAGLTADFVSSYRVWLAIRKDMYMARLFALDQKYYPLENYRSHEERSGSFTHGESVALSFTDRKDVMKDDSYVERTHTDYKETTTDDSFVTREYDEYKQTTKDDSYVDHTNDNYKETTKDDSFVTKSYTNYQETDTPGTKTTTDKYSADDASDFVNRSQDVDSETQSTHAIAGSVTDQHGQSSNGLTKEVSGSTRDQQGFLEDGRTVEQTGSYTDQHGQTENGLVKETSGSYRDTHGFTNGVVNEKQGTESTVHSGTDLDGYTLERYGNIGVTSSAQLLSGELDLLRYDIVTTAIKEFITVYTYISCEVD